MQRGETVFYTNGENVVRASVISIHRDGTITVEAKFFHRDGEDVAGYLGYRYRTSPAYLRAAA